MNTIDLDFADSLNERQREAVFHTDGPLLILAGAGSGKTRVLMYKIAYFVGRGLAAPSEILAVTFTNKAAKEMKDRIASMLPGKNFPWIGTFHSFCAKVLRMSAGFSGIGRNFVIYDESDKKTVIKEVLRQLGIDDKTTSPEKVSSNISRMKNQLKGPSDCDTSTFSGKLFGDVYEAYQNKLTSYGALDFDDLLVKTYELLSEEGDFSDKMNSRFKYILVDEYQDINYAQYMLIKRLAQKLRNITVVGDDDQSIYRFRGADMSILLKFEEDYCDAAIVKLEQNYRSTKTILSAANALMEHNTVRKEKKLWTQGDDGEKISLHRASDGRSEARFVIKKIRELIALNGYTYKDFVVIYRTNAQSRLFEEVCIQEGIPYNLVGSLKFYDRKEIKDLLAYLRLITDTRDNISFKRIVNVPPRGIGASNLTKIENIASRDKVSMFQACRTYIESKDTSARVRAGLEHFVITLEKAVEMSQISKISDVVDFIIDSVAFRDYLLTPAKNAEGIAREENLNEFINVVKEFQDISETPSLSEFLSHIALISDIDLWESSEGRVNLMTFHLTKGLEFPVVFLTGLEEKFLPHFMSANDNRAIEEERRLLYVGITRAKKKLFLTNALQRLERGISDSRVPSRFIKEIPSCYIASLCNIAQKSAFSMKNTRYSSAGAPFSYSGESIAQELINKGDSVSHSIFGKGRVISVSGDAIKVDFVTKGVKTVVRSFLNKD